MRAAALALGGMLVVVAPAPAQASNANCEVWLETSWTGRSRPFIDCDKVVSGYESRARADCTAAPDTYTYWVRSDGVSAGAFCTFGARGVIQEIRAY